MIPGGHYAEQIQPKLSYESEFVRKQMEMRNPENCLRPGESHNPVTLYNQPPDNKPTMKNYGDYDKIRLRKDLKKQIQTKEYNRIQERQKFLTEKPIQCLLPSMPFKTDGSDNMTSSKGGKQVSKLGKQEYLDILRAQIDDNNLIKHGRFQVEHGVMESSMQNKFSPQEPQHVGKGKAAKPLSKREYYDLLVLQVKERNRLKENKQLMFEQGETTETNAELSNAYFGLQNYSSSGRRHFAEKPNRNFYHNIIASGLYPLNPHKPKGASKRGRPATPTSIRSLVDREDAFQKFKNIIKVKGPGSFKELKILFHEFDTDGSGDLTFEEFKFGIAKIAPQITTSEAHVMFSVFDADGSETIELNEFLSSLRDPLNQSRAKIVIKAFVEIDEDKDGLITIEDIAKHYNIAKHPKVVSSVLPGEAALLEVLGEFREYCSEDGTLNPTQFIDYYRDISAGIALDDFFEHMVRQTWYLGAPERILDIATHDGEMLPIMVTYTDDTEDVVLIPNDVNLDSSNSAHLRDRLLAQGVTHVKRAFVHIGAEPTV